ncbi:MAG: YiiX/YebB-like N1pC/P60 family cysteine hydrolase, partial [Acholeplasmataceae bacterium]
DYSATVSNSYTNYWMNPVYRSESDPEFPYYGTRYRNEFIGIRVKGITLEQIDGAVDYAQDKVGKNLYNFLFFLDMKYKYYCTDLVSRAYQSVMVEEDKQRSYSRALNDDRFITSVNDIILSDETYIIFYVEVIDDIWHIYYLEDLEV